MPPALRLTTVAVMAVAVMKLDLVLKAMGRAKPPTARPERPVRSGTSRCPYP
jgi:hypothetical protein